MIAQGAEEIRSARLAGRRPTELIIVSLIGYLNESSKVIIAHPSMSYDWRFMRGLDVCIFAKPRTPFRSTVLDIGAQRPHKLMLWDEENHEGADCIVHWKPECLDEIATTKRIHASQCDVIYWPWVKYENQQFRGKYETDCR